jgi:hypothetical protein
MISGKESDELERWFNEEYENPANEIFNKVDANEKLTPEDWNILINFLAAQDVRTPARLFEYLKLFKEIVPKALKNSLDRLKEKVDNNEPLIDTAPDISNQKTYNLPLKIEKMTIPGEKGGLIKAETYIGRSTWHFAIKRALESTSKILHKHKWAIVKPAYGFKWFTSDNPVIKLNFTDPQKYDLNGGWGNYKGNIIFPISPEHAMFVQIGDKPVPKGTRLSVEQTKFIRKIIAENAHRMIFADAMDNEIEQILPRTVDCNKFKQEQNEFEQWHVLNKKIEIEYNI